MKRIQAIILLLVLLLGCAMLVACDSAPADVVIGDDELFPDLNKAPVDSANGGIGNNEAVDLPFVPV